MVKKLKKYVLMVVSGDFPNGDAGAVRDEAFAQIYRDLGYEVYLIGAGTKRKTGLWNNIEYKSIFLKADSMIEHAVRFIKNGSNYINAINVDIEKYGEPSIIHINDISERAIRYLVKYASLRKIPILFDIVEWYSPCEFKLGRLDKAYILNNHLNRNIIKKPLKVIAISKFLETYYQRKNCQVVRIPVIMDVKEIKTDIREKKDKIQLIYAGRLCNKDYLKEIVLGFQNLKEIEQEKFEFKIFGISKSEAIKKVGTSSLSKNIKVYGRVPREVVLKHLEKADFSLLLRPEKERYARAGFPTKSVEAMCHGVAMICNLSSDLELYLEDMKNAVIVDGCSINAVTSSLKRVLKLKKDDIVALKQNARKTAVENFDYRLYEKSICEFIKK